MPNIDYSELFKPREPSPGGHSEENSFYLQKTKEIPGRYKPYSKYFTEGSKKTRAGDTLESPTELSE